jgi:hypothetical protein
VSHRPAQRSQQLQNLTILIVKSYTIQNVPPSLQVLSGAYEKALVESESTFQSSRGGAGSIWNHLEALARATRMSGRFAYCFQTKLLFPNVAPSLFAMKSKGGLQFCIDYWDIISKTVKNRYPLPLIWKTLNLLGQARIYPKLDVRGAYNPVLVKEGDEPKLAF